MKKILMIPILLCLTIFSLYYGDVFKAETTSKTSLVNEPIMKVEKKVLGVYHSIDELERVEEENSTEEEQFSVQIKGAKEVLKQQQVFLRAEVKNAENLEGCNYFWYEDDKLIGLGKVLEMEFSKGEHYLTVKVKDVNGEETNTSMVVEAYNYHSVKHYNYDPHYGNLLSVQTDIRNHLDQYVLYDNGVTYREVSLYNDTGYIVERRNEYHRNPENNSKTVYTHTNDGQTLSSQTFNSEGESVYYVEYIYNDEGLIIDMKRGTTPDDIDENSYDESAPIYYSVTDLNATGNVQKFNENGQVTYEIHDYGDFKVESENVYDDENKLTKTIRTSTSSYDTRTVITDLDGMGNAVKRERKEQYDEDICHYTTDYTYTKESTTETQVSTILGGECSYVDEVKREYSYDDLGNVAKVKAVIDGDEGESHNTLVVERIYLNEIEL